MLRGGARRLPLVPWLQLSRRMKIVCATDFTPRAQSAARVAVELARRIGGSVELVRVYSPRPADVQVLTAELGLLEHEVRDSVEAHLRALARELNEPGGVPVTAYFAEGPVEDSLLDRARAVGADLIVMGAHGSPALQRLILGSTAERLVGCADRPVLIVPPGVDGLGAAEEEDSAGERRALRIMAALDGRRAGQASVAFVRRLGSRTACDVTFLRLYRPAEEYRRLGLTPSADRAAADLAVIDDLERALRAQVTNLLGPGVTVLAVRPTGGDPAMRLLAIAREQPCDLIVMGAESRHGWGRITHPPVARSVARHALDVAVVFVPAIAAAPAAEPASRRVTRRARRRLPPAPIERTGISDHAERKEPR